MNIQMDMPRLPDGFEYTGEFGFHKEGEYFLASHDNVELCLSPQQYVRFPTVRLIDAQKGEQKG
jgi:hypothetical protein